MGRTLLTTYERPMLEPSRQWCFFFFLGFVLLISFESSGVQIPPDHHPYVDDVSIPVRVLLARGTHAVRIQALSGELWISAPNFSRWKSVGRTAEISWIHNKPPFYFLINGEVWKFPRILLRGSRPGLLRHGTGLYRGSLEVIQDRKEFFVVNRISLEPYLVSVLGSEMNPTWELEALKAQAVAARSYAFYRVAHARSPYYDLESSVSDQVYEGAEHESLQTRKAIEQTAGESLRQGKEPYQAYFHSRCGGMTEPAENVWRKGAPQKSSRVPCPFCREHPSPWTATFSSAEILTALHQDPRANLRLASAEKSPSGRVLSLKLGSLGHEKLVTSDQLRSLLGYSRLKSSYFSWKTSSGSVAFSGVGRGHGVGMCQWGARYLAQQGKSYREILQHYYPGIALAAKLR
jgi:stage II sporulation protein D